MSHRSQIVYPFAIKIKATYGNEIFIFCFRTAEDVGPYRFRYKFYVSATDERAAVTDTTSDDHMASLQVFFENIVVAPTRIMRTVKTNSISKVEACSRVTRAGRKS